MIAEVTEVVIRGPLACECDENAPRIVRPEMPIKPIDRGMPGVNMISSVVIGKYLYHLSHYRQATKTLKDAGITIAKQTLWDWTWRSAQMLQPLWELMHQRLIQLEHLAADETTAKMVDREKPGKPTVTTYLWQYFGFDKGKAPYTVFDFARTRAHSAPKAFLGDFSGTLLTDGYSAYQCLSDEITHAGCMAHARRKFDEALTDSRYRPLACSGSFTTWKNSAKRWIPSLATSTGNVSCQESCSGFVCTSNRKSTMRRRN